MEVQNDLASILMFVGLLQVKHIICDGPLQSLAMVKAKRTYLKPLGFSHALIHAVGTGIVGLLFGFEPMVALKLMAIDGIVHYHIDFAKENLVQRNGWLETDGPFWWAFTTDQALHHMTYLWLAWLAFRSL